MIGGDEIGETRYFFWCRLYFRGRYELCFEDVLYMLRGDFFIFFMFLFYLFLCSCFTNYDTLVMIYIVRLFMVYVFYFMFCENKKFILVYLYFSTHAFMVCLVFQEFTG